MTTTFAENRSLQITWQDPRATASGAIGRTGLAFLRAILDGTIPRAPLQSTLGFELVAVEDGMTRFSLTPGEQHYNPMNAVHGGIACTLLDSAMGAAVMTTLDVKTGYTTVALTVHLTRPIDATTGPIVAEGTVLHRGSRIVTAQGHLTDARGRLLAHASTTCMLLDRPTE